MEQEPTECIAMVLDLRIGMLTELHMVSVFETFEWWSVSSVSIHISNNKTLFKYYVIMNGHEVLMGNNDTTR